MNLEKLKQKQMKLKRGGKKIMKIGMKRERGITLIALVVTIVVLLILAGVSINALFGNNGIIEKAKEAQNKMDKATENDQKEINELTNWLDNQVNGTTGGGTTGEDDNPSTTPKISRLIGTVVDKNTKAEDAYGNKITIPKGFKVVAHGTVAGSATYTYSGDNIPAVQDGIVIENGTDGNQFVWVPVGTIKNKNNTTNTITLGRYEFDSNTGALKSNTPVQVASVENCTQEVTINTNYKELSVFRAGNSATDSTAQNATARNLEEFISTTLANGGYYIARFEASGTASKVTSKYDQTVLTNITQPNAAKAAREMYGEIKENNKLVYASDLVNSYAWDTAIIFIQTYSGKTDYASHNESKTTKAFTATGKNNDKYCNIWDMSGNAYEWTTEYSTYAITSDFRPCVYRGGYYNADLGLAINYTSYRYYHRTTYSLSDIGLRPLLYVK
ncbi:MAG: type II secretion system protein [Clostridia bacterium]